MKILNFAQFCAEPDGVVFSYFEPMIASGLFVRGKVLEELESGEPVDYFETNLLPTFNPAIDDMQMDVREGRRASFDSEQLYLVYEPGDLDLMGRFIEEAITKLEAT